MKWILSGKREKRYTKELTFIPGLSDGKPEDGEWRNLPQSTEKVKSCNS
jgi:hypothetical protein